MDGGVVEIAGRQTPIEVDDASGPPPAWVAFLLTLFAGAATLLAIIFTVLPDRGASARPFSAAALVMANEETVLRKDIAALTAERAALEDQRNRLAREVGHAR